MYTIEDLKIDLQDLVKYNNLLEKVLECYKECIENQYVYYETINHTDIYNELAIYLKELNKKIKLQELYSNIEYNDYNNKVLDSYKEANNQNYILLDQISSYKEKIMKYIKNYYTPVIDSFNSVCSFFEISDEEYDYMFKKLTHFCIINNVIIPDEDDPDLIAEHLSNINDSKINKFLERVYEEIEKINSSDIDLVEIQPDSNKVYESGVIDFGAEQPIVTNENDYEGFEDLIKNIKKNGGF